MKAALSTFIEKEQLWRPHQQVLLACSGGMDSTVLAHLLKELAIPFALAHMNYQLRGTDADADQQFVQILAATLNVPFFTVNAPIDKKNLQGASVQMAARELRYEWLEATRKENGYDLIATAHHADDNAETILLNMVKGTGIQGLHGILPIANQLIRPLLFATRSDISQYAADHSIAYREDISNASADYQRNFLRHEVIPKLQEINPSFIPTMQANSYRWRMAEALYRERLSEYRKRLLTQRNAEVHIPLRKLKKYAFPATLLYAILDGYGFNHTQLQQMVDLPIDASGQQAHSATHRLVKHRHVLILAPLDSQAATQYWIEKDQQTVTLANGILKIEKLPWTPLTEIPKEKNVALVDASRLKWPLIVRKWQHGDYCYPLGMTKRHSSKVGKKKLSDLFIDLKLSVTDKENAWVLTAKDKVMWVMPYRLDDRFKITNNTQAIYRFTWLPKT